MPPIKWNIGCSGFHYREWKGEFYPIGIPQRKWFDYYTQHFNTLEINSSFYRFPTLKLLQDWYNRAPDGFTFSAKVPRFVTHFRKFVETERMLNDFYMLLKEGLQTKTGCVLFQLPPQIIYSKDILDKILTQVNPDFKNVIEFRHESWWRKDVQNILKKHNISFSGVSFPKIACDDAIVNMLLCYYRFHGVPKLFYSEYDPPFIEKIFNQIACSKKVETAYVYFNNTASLAALHNAKYFQNLTDMHQAPVT